MPTDNMPNPTNPADRADSGAARPVNERAMPRPASGSHRAAPPPRLTAAPNPASLLIALRRRWLVAATVGILLAGGASVGVWTWMPPAKATARTLVNIQGTSWLWKDSAQHTSTTDPRTHIALLKSRLVLTSALKQPKVAALDCIRKNPEPVEWLEKELQADFSAAPDVLRISLSGDNPSELITLVNEIRDAYKREVIDKERIDANARLVWLGQQREQYESRLRQSKEMQRELERKTPKDASTRNLLAGFAQQQLFFYEREIIQTQSEIRRLTAELTVQKNLEKAPADGVISPRIIEELLEKDPDYQKAQGKVRETRRLMDEFLSRSVRGEKDPGMARFRETLKQEEAAVTQLHQQLIPVYEDIIKKRRGFDFAVNTQQLETRLQVLREDEKALTALLEAQRKRIEDMANDVVRLEDLREDMSAQEKFAKRIADEEEGLKLALKVPERFTVIEEGVVTRPSELRRLLMAIGLVSLGSLGLTCLGVALWEFRAGRVSTPDDVAQDLGLNLVGTIPDAAQRYPRRGRSRRDDEANSALAEAVDATRTMLLRAAKAESLQTVMVTSAQSGEGKTLLATHLAASMAQIGHKVLLIDADLRNPIAHQVFGLEQEPGLCEFLVGDASLDDVIRQTPIDHLWMITAGHWDSRATRALAQDATRDLLQTLREQFEFIIIDTSPVLPVVDPLLIGQHIDGAIISVLRDVSRMARVYAAHQRLVNGGVRVLGAVVNGVRGEMYTGKYGYKYASRSAVRQPD